MEDDTYTDYYTAFATPPTVLCSVPLKHIIQENGKFCGFRFHSYLCRCRTGMVIIMNTLKRPISMILLLVMLMSILAIPVLAEGDPYYTHICGFKKLYNGSPENAYIRAAQRFLLCYGGEARSNILSGGGVDGGYGYYTEEAVTAYQKDKWPYNTVEQDGRVGPKTWEKIAVDLKLSMGGSDNDDLCFNGKKVLYVDTRAGGLSYYNYNGDEYNGYKDRFIVSK